MSLPLVCPPEANPSWRCMAANRAQQNRQRHAVMSLRTRAPQRQQLAQQLGFDQQPQGLYEELQHRCGALSSDAHYIHSLTSARFSHIVSARHTGIQAADGSWLAANRIQLGRAAQLVVSQYPLAEHLEAYLHTLAQQRVPLLVVLTSKQEMLRAGLPPYFCQNARYGSVAVTANQGRHIVLPHGLALQSYRLTLVIGQDSWTLEALQVENWQENQPPSSAALQALAQQVQQLAGQSPAATPWLHGIAGVGRSAILTGALALLQPEAQSLEAIVTEMRISRAPNMLETPAQLDLLADLALQLQIALLDRDAVRRTVR